MNIDIINDKLELENEQMKIGDKIPNFTLSKLENTVIKDVTLNNLENKIKIFSTFPSIDTGVCELQVKNFNQEFSNHEKFMLINVSADLPFAFSKWCAGENIENLILLSDYKNHKFGKDFGINIKNVNLLYRTVFVTDKNNVLIYIQYAKKLSDSLDLNDLRDFLKKL
ncbi:MAG: thiol peroxidase [Mycoplasma sp.]|nr:thiol peroxidase [Mycoplasma sp.]